MAMTLLEKIFSFHSKKHTVKPGEIIDIDIDVRVARDFGGANVVKKLREASLPVNDPSRTLFTFDCNPTGSDQKYATNQQICRLFARENGIKVYDIDAGIGTHLLIEKGYAFPGITAVSTDSHANVLGAVGAFGQGMGDMDIVAAWHNGKIWFKVPESVRLNFNGRLPAELSSKDIVLNLLNRFGANSLLGCSVEIFGEAADKLSIDDRITIASMATEMGAIIILFQPSEEVIRYCENRTGEKISAVYADPDACYARIEDIDVSGFTRMVSRPGKPHDTVDLKVMAGMKIDSAFIGSCTNGRISDMRKAAEILKGRKIAPGVVLKIVPATDEIWKLCLEEGIIKVFKEAGALVSNAGCAGCAAGQVGQNGQGEVTISTGNRNFPGKQGNGSVYLASPAVVAASAVAGFITDETNIPETPAVFINNSGLAVDKTGRAEHNRCNVTEVIEGKVWLIPHDDIDTDMIFHNRHLAITDLREMGKHAFGNLKGYEDFSQRVQPGDIILAGKNFGCGSSRQQAVDCFISLGVSAVIAESFGAIYERNAINAAFPVIIMKSREGIKDGDKIRVNLRTGEVINLNANTKLSAEPFSGVQYEIYERGGLL